MRKYVTLAFGALCAVFATVASGAEAPLKIDFPGVTGSYDLGAGAELLARSQVLVASAKARAFVGAYVFEDGTVTNMARGSIGQSPTLGSVGWGQDHFETLFPSRSITITEIAPMPLAGLKAGDTNAIAQIFGPIVREFGPGPVVLFVAWPDPPTRDGATGALIVSGG